METTKRTGRVFENTWDCIYCGQRNRGRDRECVGCGRPRSAKTKYNHEHIAVLEGTEAEKYCKGPDWFCECCDSYNSAELNECKSCGAPKGASKNYFQIRKEQDEWERQKIVQNNIQTEITVAQDIESDEDEEDFPAVEHTPSRKRNSIFQNLFGIAGIALTVAGLIWLVAWLVTPQQKTGTVTDLTWKTSISLEELITEKGEGWDLPIGARTISSERRFKETVQEVDHYDTVTVPVTKYMTVQDEDLVWYTYEDMGNGFDAEIEHRMPQSHEEPYTDYEDKKVPVYKDVDIYADWYKYEVDRWVTIDTKTTQGQKGEEHDPVLTAVGNKQQTTGYSRTFRIYLTTDEETEDFPVSKELYDILEIDDSVKFEINRLGTMKILEINGITIKQ